MPLRSNGLCAKVPESRALEFGLATWLGQAGPLARRPVEAEFRPQNRHGAQVIGDME